MNYLSERAKALTPYVAGIQPQEAGWVKLNTNENPYPPSAKAKVALAEADIGRLRLYPDGESGLLREAIAESLGVRPGNIFCGNGSDEVLALAFQAFFAGKANVLMPDISYGFYPVWAEMYGLGAKLVPVGPGFEISPAEYAGANGVVLANPNAPTGLALGLAHIEQIVRANPGGVVLIDEAYIDFAGVRSAVGLTGQYENLLIVRTFSKSHSLAGARVGYAVGSPALIEGLMRVKDAFNSYPLDMLMQRIAAAAIRDKAYWEETRRKIIATREKTAESLRALGYSVGASQANFLFAGVKPHQTGKAVYEHLLQHKVLVRWWEKPRISNYLRITIGLENEMEALINCVRQF
jgi:histidinol-phosphate aminotransferase